MKIFSIFRFISLLIFHTSLLLSLSPNFDLSLVGGDLLEQYLMENLKDKKVCYCPNVGNAGDALIWWGTVCLFKKLEIDYIPYGSSLPWAMVETIVYGGGGNLVPYYNSCAQFLEKHMRMNKPLVLLPHTIQGHELLLTKLPPDVTLFCREKMSYNYCKKVVPFAENILFSCDLAFYADLSLFVESKEASKPSKVLYAFRMDTEINSTRQSFVLPASNRDISDLCGEIRFDSTFEQNYAVVEAFIRTIGSYDEVWTDRLHVGIAAFMLGKRVHLFDNSYGKNRAVYLDTIFKLDSGNLVQFHTNWPVSKHKFFANKRML